MRSERLLVPSQVSETVSLCPLTNYEEKRSVSFVHFVSMRRYNEEVKMAPCLTPVAYRDTIICFTDSNKKRFKCQTLYEPKVKPRKFSDTLIIFPKRPQKSFVTCLDYHIDECRRWFKTTMEFKSRTYTTRKLLNEPNGDGVSETDDNMETPGDQFNQEGPGASQIFLPRWNKDGYDQNKNIPHLVNGELLLDAF